MSTSEGRMDPVRLLAALGNPQRWQIMQLLSLGDELTINEVVTRMGRTYRAVHKDMDVLCAAGAVTWRLAEDKRVALFHIAAEFRPHPGVVDYGFCRLRFGDAEAMAEKIASGKD